MKQLTGGHTTKGYTYHRFDVQFRRLHKNIRDISIQKNIVWPPGVIDIFIGSTKINIENETV